MMIKIKPNPNCKTCKGRGEYTEYMGECHGIKCSDTFTCDCVLNQLTDARIDIDVEYEIDNEEYWKGVGE